MALATTALWTAWRLKGDDDAFASLVRPEVPALFDAARRSGLGQQDAEDVVQESLRELADEQSNRPVEVGVGAWLMRSVRLKARGVQRSARRRRRREASAAVPPRQGEGAAGHELREHVEAALAKLEESDRYVLLLRFLYDLEYREMAYVLGISENACRIRVHRASGRLRRAAGTQGLTALALLPLAAAPRTDVVLASATAGMTATGGTAGGVLLGGLLMSTGIKCALGAMALLLVAVGLFVMTRQASTSVEMASDAAGGPPPRSPSLQGTASEGAASPRAAAMPRVDTPPGSGAKPSDPDQVQAWLFVHVTGPGGRPLAGAQVEALDEHHRALARGNTLDDGKCWFVREEIAHVVAWRRGTHAPVLRSVAREAAGEPQHLRVQLEAGRALAGRVESHDGQALERVSVRALPIDPPAWLPNPRRLFQARSDAQGRFELHGLLAGSYELHARTSPKRHPDAGLMPRPGPRFEAGERDAVIRLWSSGAIHLVILDAKTGRPVSSPRDLYTVEDDDEHWMQSVSGGGVKRERPSGTTETLRVHAEGYAPSEPIVLDYDVPGVIEVQLEPRPESVGTVTFELVDGRGGAVRSFRCTRWHARKVRGDNVVSYGVCDSHVDTRGEHRVRLPVGRHRLVFDPRGPGDEPARHLAPRDIEVEVSPGEEKHVRIAFESTGSVRVPLPARWTRAGLVLWTSADEQVRGVEGERLASGERMLHRIVPGAYEVELKLPGGKALRRAVTVHAGAISDVDFERPPAGATAGR